jgi:hypothetical protein
MALHTLTVDMQKAFRRDIKDYENPNLHVLKTCFKDYAIAVFDQKAARRDNPDMPVAVIDVWQARNDLRYNTRAYEKFPPNVKFDYVEEHNIPIDQGGLQNFHKFQKYLASNPEKRIQELADSVRDAKAERRGTPPPPKATVKDGTKKVVKAAESADNFLSSSPIGSDEPCAEKPIKDKTCDKSMEELYARYLTVRKLADLSAKYHLKGKDAYELRNILERYLMLAYPDLTSEAASAGMIKQLAEKSLPAAIHDTVLKIVNTPSTHSDKLVFTEDLSTPMITLTYGKIKINIPKYRYDILRKQGSPEEILHCALSYSTLLPGSQQWAIPLREYERMVGEGATIEGFASSFNSQIVNVSPELKYCSLMECDKKFGSLGNFFDQNFEGKTVIVNPPFIEDILEKAARKCLEELEAHPCKFIFYGPAWTDSPFYELLDKSSYKVSRRDLQKFTYEYEDLLLNKTIKAPFNSVVYVLERKK